MYLDPLSFLLCHFSNLCIFFLFQLPVTTSLRGSIHQVVSFNFFSDYSSGISLIFVLWDWLISHTLPKRSCAGLHVHSYILCLVPWAHSCCAALSNYTSQVVSILVTKIVLIFLNFTRHQVHKLQDYSALQARTCVGLLKFKQKHLCGCTIISPMCPRNLPSSNAVIGNLSLRFLLCQECFGVFIFKKELFWTGNICFGKILHFFSWPAASVPGTAARAHSEQRQTWAGARCFKMGKSRASKGEISTKWSSKAYRGSLLLVESSL